MKKFVKRLSLLILSLAVVLNIFNVSCDAVTKKKKNLFFHVDYKLPTITAIALNHPEAQNDILVLNPNQVAIDKLKKVFDHVYYKYDSKSFNEFMSKKDSYDNFFGCNWYHGHYMSFLSPNKKYCHFEDGAYEYYKDSAFNWLCKRDRVSKMFLFFPEYRFDTLKSLPAEKINRDKYLKTVKILYEPKPLKKQIIYSLDCPEFFNSNISKQILDIIRPYDVAIKCHPRDGKKYLWPSKFTVLDRNKPFESFYYGFNGIFISNLSSCLHTAKFMQPDSVVICTIYFDSSKNLKESEKYIKMLKELGVLFPKTLAELKSMISQNINKI